MTYDAFLSYRRADFGIAEGIYELCKALGLNVFLDKRSLVKGSLWEANLHEALQSCRTLLVLWSRSAQSSEYMRREWRLVPASCAIIPVRLDGCELPPDLGKYQALEGFDLAGRIVSRGLELTREQRLSPKEARAVIVNELKQDGVELAPEQRKALGVFLASASAGLLLTLLSQTRWFARSALKFAASPAGAVTALGVAATFGAGWSFASTTTIAPENPVVPIIYPTIPTGNACLEALERCQQSRGATPTSTGTPPLCTPAKACPTVAPCPTAAPCPTVAPTDSARCKAERKELEILKRSEGAARAELAKLRESSNSEIKNLGTALKQCQSRIRITTASAATSSTAPMATARPSATLTQPPPPAPPSSQPELL